MLGSRGSELEKNAAPRIRTSFLLLKRRSTTRAYVLNPHNSYKDSPVYLWSTLNVPAANFEMIQDNLRPCPNLLFDNEQIHGIWASNTLQLEPCGSSAEMRSRQVLALRKPRAAFSDTRSANATYAISTWIRETGIAMQEERSTASACSLHR